MVQEIEIHLPWLRPFSHPLLSAAAAEAEAAEAPVVTRMRQTRVIRLVRAVTGVTAMLPAEAHRHILLPLPIMDGAAAVAAAVVAVVDREMTIEAAVMDLLRILPVMVEMVAEVVLWVVVVETRTGNAGVMKCIMMVLSEGGAECKDRFSADV